ncbi:homoserine kinase [Noviherbaspirillum galbum]|uniref:Homoserine kinase n=1 Tax=Noviherbaspirillum galbum TaxID=2709383 RepID=A0A6B3SZ26_9BURK|nr:homoserine kinase [Noviherbaspirillum galbum]NEX64272.1 homoserine kinase [Noviherbaspirillum galbum]
MAVFTPVTLDDLSQWITQFNLGRALAIKGISSGIENTNFFLTTETGEYVLTIFEKLTAEQLPFYLHLMRHLAERGVLVPAPIANLEGDILHTLKGKPASIVTKLEGESQLDPKPVHCEAVGAMLARMHIAGENFPMHLPNLRGLDWWLKTTPVVLPYLPDGPKELLRAEIHAQDAFAASPVYRALPRGPIHADLFRNNVMFSGDRLTGFFDFYFGCCDTWLFDIAVTVNDWCIDLRTGALDLDRAKAMLDAYHAVRPFTEAERDAWQPMLQAGALRFWLSRLYDFYLPREAEMLTPHDPTHFERILRQRIDHPAPLLF